MESHPLRRPEAPVLLAVAGATMAQTQVVPGVLVADLALAAATGWAAALLVATRLATARLAEHDGRRWPALGSLPPWAWPLTGLLVWAVAGGLVLRQGSPLPFSEVEWAKSLVKLAFYAAAALCLAPAAARADRRRLASGILWVLAASGLVGLYVYAVMASGAPLPYRFLWAGTGRLEETALFVRHGGTYLRLRGLAAEPSYFGYLQTLGLAAAVLLWPPLVRARVRLAVVALSILLTFSLTTYALAGLAALVVPAARWRALVPELRRAGRAAAVAAALLAVVVLALPAPRQAVSEMVVRRGFDVVSGRSLPLETSRLAGSWEAFRLLAGASPLFGVGLGNYDVALEGVAEELDPALGSRGSQGWNVLAYVGATLGLPGLALVLALLALRCRHTWPGGVLLVFATFADGTWLGAPFWVVFLLLGATTALGGETRRAAASSAENAASAAASAHHGDSRPV